MDLGSVADPWSIPLELFKRTIPASAPQDVVWNGPGISQRAAAARTQRLWRWLVYVVEDFGSLLNVATA